jgi:hypothetical protein
MPVNLQLSFGGAGSVRESLALGYADNSGIIQWGDLISQSITLTENTSPPVDAAWGAQVALSAGTVTLALDALARTNQVALDLTGMSVIAFLFRNLGANAMTIAGAGSDPYELFGDATGQMTVGPGGVVQAYQGSSLAAVSGTVSDITVTGTGTQQFALILAAGDLS